LPRALALRSTIDTKRPARRPAGATVSRDILQVRGFARIAVRRDDRKLAELETNLNRLRDDLNDLSKALNRDPRNTSLVIRRVNLMGRIVAAQSTVEQLRGALRHA
jgi:hypothetical protein